MIRIKTQHRTSTTGWIGVDFGLCSTKLVQVGVQAGQLCIESSWSIKHSCPLVESDLSSLQRTLADQVATMPTLHSLFTGKRCAVSLPMAVSQMRLLDLPVVSPSEQAALVTEELLSELESDSSDLSIGYWQAAKPPGQEAGLARYAGYAVPRNLAESVGQGLLRAGWRCQTIDAVPCALARAVQMLGFRRTEDAVLAIDLSHKLPMVVLVVRGCPLFVRTLRDAGISTIIDPLCAEFHITYAECHQLLSRFGIPAPDQRPAAAAIKTMQVIHHPVNQVLSEVKRTVDFIRQQFSAYKPTQVCLFGGGAAIKNLPERLSSIIQLPVYPWSLRRNAERNRTEEAAYGLAAGLSALAMEAQLCT